MIGALDRKLVRDLWGMKGQALAIALVISSGVATYVMSVGTLDALRLSQTVYYRDYRFADVFASLTRGPESLRNRIADIPGVQSVQTRVKAAVRLEIEGYDELARGLIVSVPDHGEPLLNALYLTAGRMIEEARDDEVIISDTFAEAHGFQPGDYFYATINGRRKRLVIVGLALSPEFIYELAPGSFIPNFEAFGVMWMARTPLAAAYNMEGSFNDLALRLQAGEQPGDVIDRVDELLDRYGGIGAYSREDQTSHRYLSEEFRGLGMMATMYPTIFLSVAAFLLNVVVGRLTATQREQVAILKAFGYSNLDVTLHYLKLVALIVLMGVAIGTAGGVWLGWGLSRMYTDFYRFPFLIFELRPNALVTASLITAAAAFAGTVFAVLRAVRIPPAQAMQPAPPPRYRRSLLERLGLTGRLTQPSRMIIRNIERRPVKALLTVIGTAFACAILFMGGFFTDAVEYMMNIQYSLTRGDDIRAVFTEPSTRKAVHALRSVDGIEYVEPFRMVPARLRYEHRSYEGAIQGLLSDGTLYSLLDQKLRRVELPPEGIVLTDQLARILGIEPGEMLTVEVQEGERPIRQVPVSGVVSEWIGVSAYMQLPALNRFMREGEIISGAYLLADGESLREVYSELENMPRVVGVTARESEIQNFREIMANQSLTFAYIGTLMAMTIAIGVVYNSARIALSERSRELASLRVLGFTRGEIAYILLGEMFLLTLIAIPVGFLLGQGLCASIAVSFQTDLYRIPLVIFPKTYSFAAMVVLVSSIASAVIVKRKLDRLDLVAVLKTKE